MNVSIKSIKEKIEQEIEKSSNVFIIGHNEPDFDAIGSSIGLHTLVTALGKKAYIIVDDEDIKLESGVKKIIDENKYKHNIIKKEEFERLYNKNSLLIVTDANKDYMISVNDYLDKMNSIIVIDHHVKDEHTIKTPNLFIILDASSASEITTRLLNSFKIKYDSNVANYLLAGIRLDTQRFEQKTSPRTHDVAEKLLAKGADVNYVNSLFLEDYESFCRICNLIINETIIIKYSRSLAPVQVSFSLNRSKPEEIYKKEELAKVADRMMKFRGVDASIALGYVEQGIIHISARGGNKVDVSRIMGEMNGGGKTESAATKITSDDILAVEQNLIRIVNVGLSEEEPQILPEPTLVKRKRKK